MNFTLLFVHGKLVDPITRAEVLGRSHDYLSADRVEGFTADSDSLEFPALVRDHSSFTDGYVTVIHEDELSILNEYEMPRHEKRELLLASGKRAWAYVRA